MNDSGTSSTFSVAPSARILLERKTRRIVSVSKHYFTQSKLAFLVSLVGLCFLLGLVNNLSSNLYDQDVAALDPNQYEINNLFQNDNLPVVKERQRDVPQKDLKTILMWNDAYGVRTYDIGHGREPFYEFKCPETRCYATANRSLLPSVADFDAVLIHQRGIDMKDMPLKRSEKQRYIHWNMESAQYLYMDVNKLNGYFNWTMTYKQNSDFYLPYATIHQIKEHPTGEALEQYITEFGEKNRHLLGEREEASAAWFVSHCGTQAKREKYAKILGRMIPVDIYGKCGKLSCDRKDESGCYRAMEKKYPFYLSFENSLCEDYITEKFFNILQYNVIPVVYNGVNMTRVAPPHSYISAFDHGSPKKLAQQLRLIVTDSAKYAEYFWWRDFYEVRKTAADRAQPYCDLCKRLNDPKEPPSVVENLYKWWVSDSRCKRIKNSLFSKWMDQTIDSLRDAKKKKS